MRKIFTIVAALFMTAMAAQADYSNTLNYKCGPTEVVVTDLSTPTYNEFKLVIKQKAKNTSEYTKETLYDNTVELIIDPDEHSIVGTFTTDDYSIDANTFLKSGSSTRYVSYWETSTITIVSKGGNKYAITDGLLQVENSTGKTLYKYNYCYAADDLNNQDAEKTAFEFTFGEASTPDPYANEPKEAIEKTLNFSNMYVEGDATPIKFYAYDETTYDDIELQFNMPSYNIPAGSYDVANTGADNTIQAASGEYNGYLPAPTYISFYDDSFSQNPYFIIGGSVTVAYSQDKSTIFMTGTLTSAHGSTFTLNLSGNNPFPYTPAALINVNASENANKFLHNGQLIIRKDNKTYNTLGAEL